MENYNVLEDEDDQFFPDDELDDEEEVPQEEPEEELDELSKEFVKKLIDKTITFMNALVGHELHPYQMPLARRIIESVIINDGEEITALAARQSGKSETIANTVATLMVLLPRLAKMYPDLLGQFKDGIWVGMFAPVEGQVETLFGRTVNRLTSERASISPMLAYYSGTMVKTGTPTTSKNNFYRSIQLNKRRQTARSVRMNHFEWDYKDVSKYNANYAKFIKKEMLRIGEDSDEFQMSYNCKWLLERGMFVTSAIMDELGDTSQETVKAWHRSPVVVGIDPARKLDSTVVTVVWVDWDRPDEFGYFDHRVLNWLELQGDDWEDQYFQITNFLGNYDVLAVGVDANGVGDAVAQRLKLLLPRAEVHALNSSQPEQSKRWKHLKALIDRRMIGWPAHAKTRRLRTWKRFYQQMTDLETKFTGPNFLAHAPDEAHAHDDYADSLAIAVSLTLDMTMPSVEVSTSPFFSR